MARRVRTAEAAEYIGNVAVSTLQKWRMRDCGPPYLKLGGLVVYDLDQVDAWIEQQLRCPKSARRPGVLPEVHA